MKLNNLGANKTELTLTEGTVVFFSYRTPVAALLPSGRYVCYFRPSIGSDGRLFYEGVDQFTRQWKQIDTYGGKLVENLVQATARDVFMHGMRLAEDKGYPVCIRVHDELVCETPDTDEWTAEGLSALMATNPSWSTGLPLAAAGFESYRYRKD